MKKLLLTFCLLLTALGSSAHDFEVNGIYYNITSADDLTVAVTFQGTKYNEYSDEYTGNVIIPETITYNGKTYSVTSIGNYAFYGCSGLTSVTIGSGVTSIGSDAFNGCTGLTSVTIPEGVTSIGNYAFSGCTSLTKAEFASVESLCGMTFGINGANPLSIAHHLYINGEEVTDLVIPNSVTSIGNYAFSGCSGLSSVTIPEGVTTIGGGAFSGCTSLTKAEFASVESLCGMTFGKNGANPLSIAHHLYINGEEVTDLVIPNSVTSIGSKAFSGCRGLTSVVIPNSVTSIGDDAFYGCTSLTSVTIGSGVTSIGNSAFSGCSGLTSITIPNSVTSIDYAAFSGCSGLTSVTIPNSVTSIGEYAFNGCSGLTSVTIGNSVTSIGDYAFQGCKNLTSVTIPNCVTSIGGHAFNGCSGLTSVTINSNAIASATYSSSNTLSGIFGSKVTNYSFGEDDTGIGDYACYGCTSLTSVTIGNSVTSIGSKAFFGCRGLTSVTIGNSVTSIGDNAFQNCSGLTSLTIPSSVETISEYAFYGCTGVNALEVGATKVASNLFGLTPANIKDVSILDGVKEIEANAFKDCTNLERCSFESVEGLLKIKFGNGYANPLCQNKVLNIGDMIVSELAIPESITEVKDYALFNCRSLKSVTGGTNVKTIGVSAFSGNVKLNKVELGSKVEKIGNKAFNQCPLTSIYSYAEVPPTCGNNVFTMNAEDCKLYVPSASISRYQNHQDWYEFDIQPMISTFKLTYVVDGEVYKTFTVDSGSTLTAEPDPYKEGYTFSGWSEIPETMPAQDVVVTGTFTVNTYKVTYVVDGEEYKTDSIAYGTALTPETEPTKEGYTFSGWSEIPETMPANDVVVTGSFTVNTYKVTYVVDGEEYKTDSIDYGAILTPENEPTKEGYTFSGWSEIPETMPANDVVVTGSFTVNTYQVTFMYGEEVLKVDSVEYGAVIELPESLDSERYTLIEWLDVPETMPAHDLTIYASYTDGIEMIKNENKNEEGIYDLNGRKLNQMQRGINIIRMKDGTIRKVLIK